MSKQNKKADCYFIQPQSGMFALGGPNFSLLCVCLFDHKKLGVLVLVLQILVSGHMYRINKYRISEQRRLSVFAWHMG